VRWSAEAAVGCGSRGRDRAAVLHLGAVRFSITRPGRHTTTAHEAVDLCRLLRPRTVLPIHYEGWGHSGGGHQASADGQTFSYLADAVVPIGHEFAGAGHDVSSTLRWLPLGSAVTL
jgi:L-ascorbate metabolism protein UlaG (beta-lactamase superfamily)